MYNSGGFSDAYISVYYAAYKWHISTKVPSCEIDSVSVPSGYNIEWSYTTSKYSSALCYSM